MDACQYMIPSDAATAAMRMAQSQGRIRNGQLHHQHEHSSNGGSSSSTGQQPPPSRPLLSSKQQHNSQNSDTDGTQTQMQSSSSASISSRPDISNNAFYASLAVDIKDPLSSLKPLRPFNRHAFEAAFPTSSSLSLLSSSSRHSSSASSSSTTSSLPPSSPTPRSSIDDDDEDDEEQQQQQDPFLYPLLPPNERKRLHEFWYLTSGIHEDHALATHLQSLLTIVKELFDFDIALLQFIDNDRSSSLTHTGWQTTCYPRRETGCAHTMLLQPGTVLTVTDFATDWRFAKNPQIEAAQMRSYAGVPLAYTIEGTDESISLGSLCVMSFVKPKPALSEAQRNALVRFSDAVMHAIKDRTRLRREAAQTLRHEQLSELARTVGPPSRTVEATISTLESTFGGSKASFIETTDGYITLQGVGRVPILDFDGGMWENISLIEDFVKNHNHESSIGWNAGCTVRAIAVPLLNISNHYLLVESSQLRDVYDGSDAIFVQSCAMVIATSIQDGLLSQALEAKTSFLRNVQHAFRTSLNGILSATDMLLGEGPAGSNSNNNDNNLMTQSSQFNPPTAGASAAYKNLAPETNSPLDLLRIIESSGRGLLTVINHLIDLDSNTVSLNFGICDMHDIEEEVLDATVQHSSREKMKDVLLISDSHLLGDTTGDCIISDRLLVRQIMAALVQNAVEATSGGGVVVVTVRLTGTLGLDHCLEVDVRDTGSGIKAIDHQRIFQPFEKINAFTQNAGLGLSFASQYASTLGGSISLVESTSGVGSLFRFRLPSPVMASSLEMHKRRRRLEPKWTYWTSPIPNSYLAQSLYCDGLRRLGVTPAAVPAEASMLVQPLAPSVVEACLSNSLIHGQILLLLGGEGSAPSTPPAAAISPSLHSRTVYGHFPWTRNRMLATLLQAQKLATQSSTSYKISKTPVVELAQMSFETSPLPIRALLVDDNAMNLNILKAYCKKRAYEFEPARDGQEAFEAYVKACEIELPPTICLLDLQMPVCDGNECARMIRAYEQARGLVRCPIIMVTAQSGDLDRRSAFEAGSDACYVKPLRISTLDGIMSRYARA